MKTTIQQSEVGRNQRQKGLSIAKIGRDYERQTFKNFMQSMPSVRDVTGVEVHHAIHQNVTRRKNVSRIPL